MKSSLATSVRLTQSSTDYQLPGDGTTRQRGEKHTLPRDGQAGKQEVCATNINKALKTKLSPHSLRNHGDKPLCARRWASCMERFLPFS